jgi:hypothetical protein
MALSPGTRLGPYEIAALLGVGGMGEVYRANDTSLKRRVAIKVLPGAVAADPERLARFQREAEVLAALNHPHIAALYGLERSTGTTALVMELVEGPTLADRIAEGALPLDEAVPIATQIAEALEAAHEQGIAHRDLKPANVKVRGDGVVKVLDFGLAKAVDQGEPGASVSQLPTITTPAMTRLGVVLGTAAYMSPEQAKGRRVDKRTDVWAFGAVLYEMLTGTRAFDGEDTADVLGAVTRLEPDWSRLPPEVPPAIRTVLQRCLVKDPRQRVAEISTATFVLREWTNLGVAPGPALTTAAAVSTDKPLARTALLVATAVALTGVVGGLGVGMWSMRGEMTPPVVATFAFTLPEGQFLTSLARQTVALSPDGTQIAYVSGRQVYIRGVNELEPRAVPGAETSAQGVTIPMFAPDGQSLAFFALGEGGGPGFGASLLKRIPIGGGTASTLASLDTVPNGATWSPGGFLIGQTRGSGIVRVPLTGGTPERVVATDPSELVYGPQMLPDGKTVLFTVTTRTGDGGDPWDDAQVVAQPLGGGDRRVLIQGGSDGRYLPTGHLVYSVAGTMFVVPFDAGGLSVTGSPVPAIVGVRRSAAGQTGATHAAISDSGTLVYVPGPVTRSADTRASCWGTVAVTQSR